MKAATVSGVFLFPGWFRIQAWNWGCTSSRAWGTLRRRRDAWSWQVSRQRFNTGVLLMEALRPVCPADAAAVVLSDLALRSPVLSLSHSALSRSQEVGTFNKCCLGNSSVFTWRGTFEALTSAPANVLTVAGRVLGCGSTESTTGPT